jgi:hypothetical protein
LGTTQVEATKVLVEDDDEDHWKEEGTVEVCGQMHIYN